MMLEFKRFIAIGALEFSQSSALVVTDHVTLQAVDISEILLANTTRL